VLQIPQPSVSRHLAYLRRAGLVAVRKQGLWSYYALAPVSSPFQQSLLHCLETCFRDVPDLQADANAGREAAAVGRRLLSRMKPLAACRPRRAAEECFRDDPFPR
jgi:ArsR family transcriptional regulator